QLVRLRHDRIASTVHNLRIGFSQKEIKRKPSRLVAPGMQPLSHPPAHVVGDSPCLSCPETTTWPDNKMGGFMTTFETIVVERPEPRIARIVMNRPEARTAQNLQMTYDLNAAFDQAVQDDTVKVIILAGNGPHFSSGHDLRPGDKNQAGTDFPP